MIYNDGTMAQTIRAWLNHFKQDVANKNLSDERLANSVVMLGIAAWPVGAPEADPLCTSEEWIRRHQATYARAIIRTLKRHRRWAPVRRFLLSNQGRDYPGRIAAAEYHPHLVEIIRKYG